MKENPLISWPKVLLLPVGLCLTSLPAGAGEVLTFFDRASFLEDTMAAATAPLPLADFPQSSRTVGDLTFTTPHGQSIFFGHRSDRIDGYEIGINDREHLNIDLAAPVYALGWDFVEPQFDPLVNAPFVDSTFTVTLLSGGASGTVVGSFTFNAPEDTAYFVGAWSNTAFDRVEVRETVGGIENEWFGQFYTGTEPLVLDACPIAEAGPDQLAHPGITVILDGSGSFDPNGGVLGYEWSIISKPQGSSAVLSDPNLVNPTFVPDLLGDYLVELVVIDDTGLRSGPDQVLISTYNVAPVAEAGPDQSVQVIGSTVELDGTQSYDEDGDSLTYQWAISAKPGPSSAELSDPSSPTPNFELDTYGEYVISLVVTDILGAVSAADFVTISFSNLKPVADAGGNQAVLVGDDVLLDASGSSDPNNDPLSYEWTIVVAPAGSGAALSSQSLAETSFVPDLPGEYVIRLFVSDGLLTSEPTDATIMVISRLDAATGTLTDAIFELNLLDPSAFKNANMQKTLTNKINAVLGLMEEGLYAEAAAKLEHDILAKMDGCAASGGPDANDWIVDCAAQTLIHSLIAHAIHLMT